MTDRTIRMLDRDLGEFVEVLFKLGLSGIQKVSQFTEKYGEGAEDIRSYDVYLIESEHMSCILKKTTEREVLNYSRYLSKADFSVPKYLGSYAEGEDHWILIEYIDGSDVSHATDELVISAAEVLCGIQNYSWDNEEIDSKRFEAYYARVRKRSLFVAERPEFKAAYQLFLDRQLTAPRTLSHGDFAQFNLRERCGKAVIIDWGFGGIMPYSLDIARFIAHASEDGQPFGMYMTNRQKQLFVDTVYEKLERKPDYEQYLADIQLAVLNEYVEFMEAQEDGDYWYEHHAIRLVKEILGTQKG